MSRVKSQLTLHTTPFIGKPEEIPLYVDGNDYLGVPRNWGYENRWVHAKTTIEDRMVQPFYGWPDIQFPGDGTYWAGQKESIEGMYSFLRPNCGGLLEAGCGAGKTLMGMDIASRFHTPTLILVHKTDLADQWHETAKTFFPTVLAGHVQGDVWNWRGKHYVVATAQTIVSRKDALDPEFIANFGCVIFDEGHRYPARTFEQILGMFPARRRLAVSATWRRNDGLEAVWHWHVGHVGWRTKSVRLTGEYVQVEWRTSIKERDILQYGKLNISKALEQITASSLYNEWLTKSLMAGAGVDRKVLLVSDRIEHLVDIRRRLMLAGCDRTVGMYVGQWPDAAGKRKVVKKDELEQAKSCDIILATYKKMNEGTDIPALDTLILGTPKSDVEQVVGRIQRHKEDKRKLLIIDPVFQTPSLIRMGEKREKVYKNLGFVRQS